MHPRKSTVLFIVLLTITFSLIFYSSLLLIRVGSEAVSIARINPGPPAQWYLVMLGERIDSPFWLEVFAGAQEVVAREGSVIELVGPSSDAERKTMDEYLDYAVGARPNGILAYLNNNSETETAMITAQDKGIPVLALENDPFPGLRQSFVGVSSYELGKRLGSLAYACAGSTARVLVILDDTVIQTYESILLSSLQESISSYVGIKLLTLVKEDTQNFAYEEAIRRRIMEDPDLDVVICLNVEDTMRVTQAVIDLNQSDRISILAFRDSPEILEYVRKGIIHAVVAVDAHEMGVKAAEAMLEFLENGHTNDYVITELHEVTSATLEK